MIIKIKDRLVNLARYDQIKLSEYSDNAINFIKDETDLTLYFESITECKKEWNRICDLCAMYYTPVIQELEPKDH